MKRVDGPTPGVDAIRTAPIVRPRASARGRQSLHRSLLAFLRALIWLAGICIIALNAWWLTFTDNFRDFGSFIAAARNFLAGASPYSAEHPMVFFVEFDKLKLSSYSVNLNPPLSVLLFAPAATLNPILAFGAWRLVSLFLYAVATLMLMGTYVRLSTRFRALWFLGLAGFWHTLELGQIYVPLLLLTVAAWIALRSGRRVVAGLLIGGLIAIKPNFLIWPLFLLVSGVASTGVAAILTALALSAIPLILFGPGIYRDWLRASTEFAGMAFPGNSSLPGLFVRFDLTWVGYVLGFGLVVILAVVIRKYRLSHLDASALALVTSLLAAPIAWAGYTLFLTPVYASRPWSRAIRISAAMLTMPFLIVLLFFQDSRFGFVIMGWWYGWAVLWLLFAVVHEIELQRRFRSQAAEQTKPPLQLERS